MYILKNTTRLGNDTTYYIDRITPLGSNDITIHHDDVLNIWDGAILDKNNCRDLKHDEVLNIIKEISKTKEVNKMEKYFTRYEILEDIKEYLQHDTDIYTDDLLHEVFNTDFYITGSSESKEALNQFGVYKAFEIVEDYERSNYGELYTRLSDPHAVANMLYYIKADEIFYNEIYPIIEKFNSEQDYFNKECVIEILKYIESEMN